MMDDLDFEIDENVGIDKATARRERYELRNPDRGHRKGPDYVLYGQREFIFWDGEQARDVGYCLFGSSKGHRVKADCPLTTQECLDLILQAKQEYPYSIHVWFGGPYDWDQIIRESIPAKYLRKIKDGGGVKWLNYYLKEIPRKIYTIRSGETSVDIYETFGWFNSSYAKALETWRIGPWAGIDPDIKDRIDVLAEYDMPLREKVLSIWHDLHDGSLDDDVMTVLAALPENEVVQLFKHERGSFVYDDIDLIEFYMGLELKYGPELMNAVREKCQDAGFNPKGWYGPSALAAESMRKHKVKQHMRAENRTPAGVIEAARYAYAGGRFEMFRGGVYSDIKYPDINSAYPYALSSLPDLGRGYWVRTDVFEPGSFGVWMINYDNPPRWNSDHTYNYDKMTPYPLFKRNQKGVMSWPNRVLGWYWTPEAELVAGSPYAEFLDGWVFRAESDYRPFWYIPEMFAERRAVESLMGKLHGLPLKLAMNSTYGHTIRQVGWDEKKMQAPPFHQLEWGGYITSTTRAMVYRAAVQAGDRLISIDTDSVVVMGEKLDLDYGDALGQWDAGEAEYGVFWQNGVYFLRADNTWVKGRSRGVKANRGKIPLEPEILIDRLHKRDYTDIEMPEREQYITVRMELNGIKVPVQRWASMPGLKLKFGGSGKRHHIYHKGDQVCKPGYCEPETLQHAFHPTPNWNEYSYPRELPWRKDGKPDVGYTDLEIFAEAYQQGAWSV